MHRGIRAIGWVLALVPAGLMAADAQVESARQCAQQKDSLQRLVCYDRIFQAGDVAPAERVAPAPAAAVVAAPVAPPAAAASPPVAAAATAVAPPPVAVAAPAAAASVAAVATPSAAPALGDESLKKARDQKAASAPQNLESTVASLRETRPNVFRLTLDNGQTWQQQEPSSLFYVKVGETVRIEKGSMGSYRMGKVGGGGSGWGPGDPGSVVQTLI